MKRSIRNRPGSRAFALAVLLLPLAATSFAQTYTAPGHTGELPNPEPTPAHTIGVTSGPTFDVFPGRLACGKEYFATIVVTRKTETCDGVDYTELYRRAVKSANALGDSRRCDPGCGPPHVFQIGRKSSCSSPFGAQFELKIGVVCPKGAPPVDMDPPTTQELSEPTTVERGKWSHVRPGTYVTEDMNTRLRCNATSWIHLVERTLVDCAGPGFDFEKYVERARAESRPLFDSLACDAPCVKSKWEDAAPFVSWSCKPQPLSIERQTVVDVWMKVTCSPP